MIIFKCKMCGGDLEIDEKMSVGTCQHCSSTMTLAKASEEKVTSLFNRANHYRRNSEFDKAIKVYENILNEENTNAEAYWGLVLCKYGIEYVEDPATGQRIPTCHRTQKTSIFLDVDYKQALEYADAPARQIYEAEAAAIDAIQKQILAISAQEAPYDIFICYKETSATGSRTKDSVLAQDIYHHLTEAGYKVFFSRISLEDKLGTAYEPYIFAALNSSPAMIVVATSTESVSAVWTKNEWSRYLALINKGEKKTLIPVYRDMDPYDLPEEFAHLQAQDMGRLGFMQDLVRGVNKIFDASVKRGQHEDLNQATQGSATAQSLLDRAFICLEASEWSKADELIEQVLNIEPRNARAYIGKIMVDLKVETEEDLSQQTEPINSNNNYQKALKFAEEPYRSLIDDYNKSTFYYNALKIKENRYANEKSLLSAAAIFDELSGYKDADGLAVGCRELAENYRQSTLFVNTLKTKESRFSDEASLLNAAAIFDELGGYKEAEALAAECRKLAEKAKMDAEKLEEQYQATVLEKEKCNSEQTYLAVAKSFEAIRGYKNADNLAKECRHKARVIAQKAENDAKKANAQMLKFAYVLASIAVIALLWRWCAG